MITAAAGMAACGLICPTPRPSPRSPRILVRRADPDRLRLSRPAGAGHRPPSGHLDGLLRHQPPRDRGPRHDAHDRRSDRGLRRRCQPAQGRAACRRSTIRARCTSGSAAAAIPRSTPRCRRTRASAGRPGCARAATSRSSRPAPRSSRALEAAASAARSDGIATRVVDMHTIKPLDAAEVRGGGGRDRGDPERRGAQRDRRPRQCRRRDPGRAARGCRSRATASRTSSR